MELEAQWLLWITATMALVRLITLAIGRSSRHGRRIPPGPFPFPVVGSLFMLGELPHRSLGRLAMIYGPIMSIKLGSLATIVVSSPETAREVLLINDKAFCGRSPPDTARALGHDEGSIAWLPPNQLWRSHRKICRTKLFDSRKMEDTRSIRHEKVRALIAHIRRRSIAGEAVDIGRDTFTTILNVITTTFFSVDMADHDSNSVESFIEAVRAYNEELGSPNISDFFPILAALDLQGRRSRITVQFKKLQAIFDELIDTRLQAKKEETSCRNDFLDSLLESLARGELDRNAIKSLLVDLIVAGTESISSTVEWAMAELLRSPGDMERARAELAAANIGEEFEESDIERLVILQSIVKETLRLHPAGPLMLPHRAEATASLCGYVVAKGTKVLVNAWAIGRDEDAWKDPDEFVPERFLEGDVDFRGRDFQLIPFGAGRRMCPGLPLASRMVPLMLGSLLHGFQWRLPDGMEAGDVDMSERFGLALTKADPLLAIPFFFEGNT